MFYPPFPFPPPWGEGFFDARAASNVCTEYFFSPFGGGGEIETFFLPPTAPDYKTVLSSSFFP